jgi:hypothetical protein
MIFIRTFGVLFLFFQVMVSQSDYHKSGGTHMKKLVLIFMILLSLCVIQFSFSASSGQPPRGLNHLSLSNLKVHPYAYTAETISNIRLIKHEWYTFAIDFDTLGRHLSNLGDLWIEVEFFPGPHVSDIYFQTDLNHDRVYLEFLAEDIDFRIALMPIDDESSTYNIILYQGHYAQFPGFEPYLHPNDIKIEEGMLPMDYDHRLSTQDISDLIIAKDPFGHTLSKTLESDTYSSSSQLPGQYQMVFSTLYNQVRKRYILDIRVLDITAPVIHNDGIIEIPLSQKKPVQEIVQMLTVSDNVDVISPSELMIVEDHYSTANSIGQYQLKLKAIDSSGNQSEETITIALIDRRGPSITGPSSIYVYSTDTPLTNDQIKSKFTAIDDVDGPNVTLHIYQNNYSQKTLPGIYLVDIGASDSQGNTTSFMLYVHVVDNRSPQFVIDTQILSKTTVESMTDAEIVDWFKSQMLSIGMSVSHVRILYNEYEQHSNKAGQYYVYLSYEQDGTSGLTRILVDVTEADDDRIPGYIYIPIALFLVLISTVFYVKMKKK